MPSDLKKFVLHFLKEKGLDPEHIDMASLPGDGSIRLFWRIFLPQTGDRFIAMANPPLNDFLRRENLAYLKIGKHLHNKKIPVPDIYQYDLENGWFIMENLGQTNLQDLILSKTNPIPDYEKILETLCRLQIEGAKGFDPSWCCQTQKYDRSIMLQNESHYFKDSFLCNYLGLKKNQPKLEPAFEYLADISSKADADFFLHRDFQSRNIMISATGDIGIIDWQGGRLGPLGYDLASLIIDPYTELSSKQKNDLVQTYILMIREHNAGWAESLEKYFTYLAIQRNLQILGAFAFLTKEKNKKYFETYIPPAQKNLRKLVKQINDPRLTPIKDVLDNLDT